jgi:hypothetical protein
MAVIIEAYRHGHIDVINWVRESMNTVIDV